MRSKLPIGITRNQNGDMPTKILSYKLKTIPGREFPQQSPTTSMTLASRTGVVNRTLGLGQNFDPYWGNTGV